MFGGSAWGKGGSWLELFGSRGARCCVDFSDGGWNSRLGFSFLVWLVHGRKMQCWDWFEMFHMFIHICIYVFFFRYLCLALTHTHGPQPVSLPYNLTKKGPSPG